MMVWARGWLRRAGVLSDEGATRNPQVAAALLTTALVCVLANQFAQPGDVRLLFPGPHHSPLITRLLPRLWQTVIHLVLYFAIPGVVARAFGVRPLWGLGDGRRVARTAAVLFGLALPIVIAVSFVPGFLRDYPLFPTAAFHPWLLLVWLPLLATYLFTVEFFYRGFLLPMLWPSLGRGALFVMIIPYALTHPSPVEALGAVPVGLLLGGLAVKARSIWPGWLLHVSVAFAIELLAIWQLHRH